jgi:arsenate reductase (glutaredoxin)
MTIRIYHNPACSKSRAALALLEVRGAEVEIVDYLQRPPSREQLRSLLHKLAIPAIELVRTSEPEYAQVAPAGSVPPAERLLDLLHEHPRLLQRPVVEVGERAVIGRPPERILEILP